MSALDNYFQKFTYSSAGLGQLVNLAATSIDSGVSIGNKIEIHGFSGVPGCEGLAFTVTSTSPGLIVINLDEHGLTKPSSWTAGGVVRYYQAPLWPLAMRIPFARRRVLESSIASTGDTGEYGVLNAFNDDRGRTHTLPSGTRYISFNTQTGENADWLTLLDFTCSSEAEVRITGTGPTGHAIDAAYPAIEERYTAEAHNPGWVPDDSDPVPHFTREIPELAGGAVAVHLTGSTSEYELSQVILCYSYQLSEKAKTFVDGLIVTRKIDSKKTWNGVGTAEDRAGVIKEAKFSLSFLNETDIAALRLLAHSEGNNVFVFYPKDASAKWLSLIVGTVSEISVKRANGYGFSDITVTDTKRDNFLINPHYTGYS